MDGQKFIIRVEHPSVADAGFYAEELKDALLDEIDGRQSISVERKREDPLTQDFGATLVVVIVPSVIAAAVRIILDQNKRNHEGSLSVEKDGKKIDLKGVNPKDAYELVRSVIQSDNTEKKDD